MQIADRRLKIEAKSACALAILDYQAHGCRKFKEHLRDHLANGYVFCTPNIFVMGKAVALEDGRVAWYITYARGDLRILAAMIPFPLPYIAWRRLRNGRETLRVYPFERVARLTAFIPHSAFRIPHSQS